MKFIKSNKAIERKIENINFEIIKFNNKKIPNKNDVIIICCFSEFGCETVGAMYTVPKIIQDNPNKYIIIAGWHGREYFYRHLVDEFWEIKKEHMWLREFSRAFHHISKNLSVLEKSLELYGKVISSAEVGNISICSFCHNCKSRWSCYEKNGDSVLKSNCDKCKSSNVVPAILQNVSYWKPKSINIPPPSEEKIILAKQLIKKPTVAIFARGRKCYGRNLQSEFYISLIEFLEKIGYNPIWLGEEVSVQPCPVKHIKDFSRMKESEDLEFTLALIKNCEFTIQFWTASTRLSGMMGVPYILFESPDQIWGKRGQEGIRRNLCDIGKRKLSINHFLNVFYNNRDGLEMVKKCIDEIRVGNYDDIIGLVESPELIKQIKKDNDKRIGVVNV
jgi:hypothetical protein